MTSDKPHEAKRPPPPEAVVVRLPITLGQFVKLAGFVGSGGEAKLLVTSGDVRVNGQAETRRGRKLEPGDVVDGNGRSAMVIVGTAARD
jgi:ribosome-associated protein